jgi:acetamidase/formamidase
MAADAHITQLVDGNVGVHMVIPKKTLTKRGKQAPERSAIRTP